MKLPDYMREKIETAIRARLRANAQANGYPPKVLEAMVSKSIELYRITYADGSAEYLKAGELELLEKQIADGEIEREIADREIVAAEGRLLTLTAHEAVEHGLSKEVLTTPEDFYLEREITLADRVEPSVEVTVEEPQEKMSLGWTIILIFCLVIGVAGVVVEANVPGFGVPGVIGICGFAAFFAILALRFARADDWEIALFVIGLVLILVELFVIPGFGVAGILGVVAVLASIVLAFLPDFDSELMEVDFTGQLEFMIQVMGAASFASILVGWLLVKFVNRIPLVRRAVLATHLKSGSEVWASVAEEEAGRYPHEAEQRKTHQESALKGKEGVATTVLRPSGKIRLEDGRTLDVVSDGGMVPEGSRVRVHEVNGPRITVMPVPEE
jgi:membrane-bound serine protease (ClpP class)